MCSLLGGKATEIANQLNLTKFPVSGSILTADGTKHPISFYIQLPMEFNNQNKVIPIVCVVDMPDIVIFGMDFFQNFNMKLVVASITLNNEGALWKNLEESQKNELMAALEEFPTSEKRGRIGRTHMYFHKIDTGNSSPTKQRYYPMSKFLLDDVNKEVDRMLKMDIIEEAFCCPWNSPVVAVRKNDQSMRLCLDARALNKIVVPEAYPIPLIASIMQNLSGSKWMASIDLEAAFWQIPLEDSSKQKTAFTIPQRGHYQYKVVPFGLCTASQALSRIMTSIFIDLEPEVFVYLDDIIVATQQFKRYVFLLQEVARRLNSAGFTINSKKSRFCMSRLRYLGYILDENGWNVDPEKTQAITCFPQPENRKEVQRFLGMCGWYRRFIQNFAKIAAPLTELTKAKTKFKWTDAAERALQHLKQCLTTTPVLATPDYSKPFQIATDASEVAIGGVLTQLHDSAEVVICYHSEKLSSSERKYSPTERECLAVIRCIEKFRGYVEGSKFTVFCDHASLEYLRNMKNPSPLMARWILRLNAFRFDVKYRKGALNKVPDCLSRIQISMCNLQRDNWFEELLEEVTTHPDKYPDFRVVQKELYKHCMSTDNVGARVHVWKQVVPEPKRADLIRKFHDIPTAAHLGVDRTLNKIQKFFYWPHMAADIRRYVSNCKVCKAVKAPNECLTPTMGGMKPASQPWELISVDWVGPMVRSKKGNTVILVIVDWFTKYVIAEPFRTAETAAMIAFMENYVFLKFSTPRIVLSDNGSQFTSQAFASLLRRYKIIHMRTGFYSPMCNNAERVNRTLITCVRALLDEDHRQWDEHLQQIVCAINSAKHEASGISPHSANFGREMIIFTDLYRQQTLNASGNPAADQETRIKALRNVHEFVRQRLKDTHEKSRRRYDMRARKRNFEVGELVWRRSFHQSSKTKQITKKLGPKFIPSFVRERIGLNNYKLEDVTNDHIGVYHAKDIKAD